MEPHYTQFVVWWFLFLTSIEAAHSPRHRLSEDHSVLFGGTSILTMGVVVHTNLRCTMQTHKYTHGHRTIQSSSVSSSLWLITPFNLTPSLIINYHIPYWLTSQDIWDNLRAFQWGYIYTSDNVHWSCWPELKQKKLWKQAARGATACIQWTGWR